MTLNGNVCRVEKGSKGYKKMQTLLHVLNHYQVGFEQWQ